MVEYSQTSGTGAGRTATAVQTAQESGARETNLQNNLTAATKTQAFENFLNDKQQITELKTKQQTTVFDPANNIVESSIFGQTGQTTPL